MKGEMMTLDEAIAALRRTEPQNTPWPASRFGGGYLGAAISTVLNAVDSGDLVPATRAEAEAALAKAEGKTLEQITRETCDEIDAIFARGRAEKGKTLAESGPEFLARVGLDASKWAAEFRAIAKRLGYSDMDEGWLIGWFANAIEAARAAPEAEGKTLAELDVKPGDVVRWIGTLPRPLNGPSYTLIEEGESAGWTGVDSAGTEHSLDCRAAGWVIVSRATAPAPDVARDERRFQAALAAMPAIIRQCAGDLAMQPSGTVPEAYFAAKAVACADALLAALEARQ